MLKEEGVEGGVWKVKEEVGVVGAEKDCWWWCWWWLVVGDGDDISSCGGGGDGEGCLGSMSGGYRGKPWRWRRLIRVFQ